MNTNSISSPVNPQPAHESSAMTRYTRKLDGRLNDREGRLNDKINKLGAQNIRQSYQTSPNKPSTQLPVGIARESPEIGTIREGIRKQNGL